MLVNVAFSTGIIVSLAAFIHNISIWIMSSLNQVKVEKIGSCYGHKIYRKTINKIEISLGCFPSGGFIRLSGIIDESLDAKTEVKSYDFRGKSTLQRTLILSSGVLLPFTIGLLLLFGNSPLPLNEILLNYLSIAFFQLPLDSGNFIWELLYNDFIFLTGFSFLLTSVSTSVSTLYHINCTNFVLQLLKVTTITTLYLFLFSLWVVLIRLVWLNFAITHIFFFFTGGIFAGALSVIPYIITAKVIPNA